MTVLPRRFRWLAAAILASYIGLACWYSAVIPLGEAPDEVPQFTNVRYVAQNHRLSTNASEHESFQPPLYYMMAAALTSWIKDAPGAPFGVWANADFDSVDPRSPKNLLLHNTAEDWPYRGWVLAWHLVRLLSIAFGAITVWAVYQLGRVIFPSRQGIALFLAALIAFTPQFLFISAVANNDSAATGFSALILWQIAVLLHRAPRTDGRWLRWRCVALGLLLGLGLLSKTNLLALVPVVALAILVSAFLHRESGVNQVGSLASRRAWLAVSCLLLTGASAAALSGWLFLRNLLEFGDPLGWSLMLSASPVREDPLTLAVLRWLFSGLYQSFWLKWAAVQLDRWIYSFIGVLCIFGLAGFFVSLFRRWRLVGPATRWTLALFSLDAAITIAALVRFTAAVLATEQARLIYPIAPIVMLVLVAGWAWWFRGRMLGLALGVLGAGMLFLAIVTPLRYIGPTYARAPRSNDEEVNAAESLNVDWDGIRLLGYRLDSNRAQPGDKLGLHLYWEALEPVDGDLMVLIQLLDTQGKFLVYTDGSPSAGRDTTDRWEVGVPLASLHLLQIPDYAVAGEYRLCLGIHPAGERKSLSAIAADGSILGERINLPEVIHIVSR
jgi:hypothetical protein